MKNNISKIRELIGDLSIMLRYPDKNNIFDLQSKLDEIKELL